VILLVAGGLAAGVWCGVVALADRPALVARAGRAEGQVAALDATLAITRAQYDTERQLWAAALGEAEETRRW
jgi:hypothetical protein